MTDFLPIKKAFGVSEACGIDTKQLQAWIDKFGAIPKVLSDYYAELGAHEYNRAQDYLISPNEISDNDDDYLVFYSENQGVCIWGIHKDDVSKDNPAVYENYGEAEWYKTAETLTEFLTSMALLQTILSQEYSNEDYWEITGKQADAIANHFKTKNANSGLYTGVRFFGDYDDSFIVIINNNDNFILMFSSSNEEHFEEMYDEIEEILNDDNE